MVFRVIQGGLSMPSAAEAACADKPSREDVEREASRRLNEIQYDGWKRRQAAGIEIPREIKYLAMQIGFAAEAIASLRQIPADFRSDLYWPGADAQPVLKTGP